MAGTKLSVMRKDFEYKDNSLSKILNEKLFTDVTLACNDGKQIDAHRLVLGSQSLFFEQILKANNRKDILICIPNIHCDIVESILEFIYNGRTEIAEEQLKNFLNFGKEFGIKGLEDMQYNLESDNGIINNIKETGYKDDNLSISKSLMKRLENGKYACDQCDYQSVYRRGVKRHQEMIHLNVRHSCDECPKEYKDESKLKMHKKSAHEGIFYQCDLCNKTYSHHASLLQHERDHQGINTNCTLCKKSFGTANGLYCM